MKRTISICLILLECILIIHGAPTSSQSDTNQQTASDNPEESGHYQGDMVLQPNQKGRGVAIRPIAAHRWPNGVVPYEFAGNITPNHTVFIEQMMREMESLTAVNNTPCITFRPKNSSDTVFITIYNGTGCFAPVGSWPGYNGLRGVSLRHSPPSTCMISGTIQHELAHVLGFFHEQSRPDRDTYVSIQWSNIQSSSAFNFDKYNDSDVDTLSTPYDYGSVMHYGATAFAINSSSPTIIAVFNSSANLGQRIRLSPIDILEIQRGYGCVATPVATTTTTMAPGVTTTTTATASTTPAPTTTPATTATMAPGVTSTTTATASTTPAPTTTPVTTPVTTASTATMASTTVGTTLPTTTAASVTVTVADGVPSLFNLTQFLFSLFCLLILIVTLHPTQ